MFRWIHIEGDLSLNSLTSAKGLKLPEHIGGSLDLRSLTSAEGLDLSNTSIGYFLYLNNLTSAKCQGFNLTKVCRKNYLVK